MVKINIIRETKKNKSIIDEINEYIIPDIKNIIYQYAVGPDDIENVLSVQFELNVGDYVLRGNSKSGKIYEVVGMTTKAYKVKQVPYNYYADDSSTDMWDWGSVGDWIGGEWVWDLDNQKPYDKYKKPARWSIKNKKSFTGYKVVKSKHFRIHHRAYLDKLKRKADKTIKAMKQNK